MKVRKLNIGIWAGLLSGFLSFPISAQTVRVGLLQDQEPGSVVLSCESGHYQILLDDSIAARMAPGDVYYATLEEAKLRVLGEMADLGLFGHLELQSLSSSSVLELRIVNPGVESRHYDDNLEILPSEAGLILINEVDMDKYLAGVVEIEASKLGSEISGAEVRGERAFYKTQATLCRTRALKEMDKHAAEGFSLCDGIHCMEYHGRAVDPAILESIVEAGPQVLADFNFRLIRPAYHLNSGGQTRRAATEGAEELPYLQSVVDPYSLHQPHAKWRDTLIFDQWKSYLVGNGVEAAARVPEEIIYVEQQRRKKHFSLDGDTILISRITKDYDFPSAFFDMFPDGDNVLVWGKGYGHGYGLAQEGAMKMAMDGYDFRDILQFYFFDIRLMDYRDLPRSSLPDVLRKP